jgi:hypothetical protein
MALTYRKGFEPPSSVRHWRVLERPSTQYRSGSQWRGVPGGTNPKPGTDYRLRITWGPVSRSSRPGQWLEHVTLRVVFLGWHRLGREFFRNKIQFYTSDTFGQRTPTRYRVHIDYPPAQTFRPDGPKVVAHAYFRVTAEVDRAWRMRYDLGVYGAYYAGSWTKAAAR